MNKNLIIIIAAVVIVGAIFIIRFSGAPESAQTQTGIVAGFARTGVAVKDAPGMEPDVFYSVYEEPGKPALKVKLQFDAQSICGDGMHAIACMALSSLNYELVSGKRISVAGIDQGNGTVLVRELVAGIVANDVKDATYSIDHAPVTLVGGRASSAIAPNSATKLVTQYFGNEAVGDLNGDGVPDTAFLLTQSGGGSGTFYYVAVALGVGSGSGIGGNAMATGYRGTNAVLLGDRIAPQTTEIRDGELIVNYATRAPGEPMSASASVGVSKRLKMSVGQLVEEGNGIRDTN